MELIINHPALLALVTFVVLLKLTQLIAEAAEALVAFVCGRFVSLTQSSPWMLSALGTMAYLTLIYKTDWLITATWSIQHAAF